MNYPTDLSAEEQLRARARLADLAEQFMAKEILRTPVWREVFERTWRHPYVPGYYPDKDTPPVLCIDGPRRGEWLDAVYSDTTLITKLMPVPLSRSLRPALGMTYTSSSTLPSLVLDMLEQLDIADGHRVLEIGTGTGYNAALLCERLDSAQVTSVDIDPELIDLARERLAANGHTPTLAAVDGHTGYPPGAPYDRIIATCAVPAIPPAWLDQAAPGAVILTDVHGPLGGTLARLTVDEHGTATGRFVPHWAGFMTMRHDVEPADSRWPVLDLPATESWTTIDPLTVNTHGLFGFIVQWQLPDVTHGRMTDDDGQPAVFLLARDGSRAEVATTATARGYPVRQYGPQRLWDHVEQAATFWNDESRPSYERFGLTATTHHQHVWYDQPDGPHRWSLPLDTRTGHTASAGTVSVGAVGDAGQRARRPPPGLAERTMTMSGDGDREPAARPEDLSRFFVERANADDVDGVVALYEPGAVLALPAGQVATGAVAIRRAYEQLLAGRPTFTAGDQRPALVNGELALTSTRIPGGATAEVARRQPDGTWLWVADRPNVLGG